MRNSSKSEREPPIFYGGDELHKAKLEKVQKLLEARGLDAVLFLKSEAVRYVTDFYAKGFRPFMELEYLTLVPRGGKPVLAYTSGSDNYRLVRSDVRDTRQLPRWPHWTLLLVEILTDYGLTSARLGTDLLPFNLYLAVRRELPKVEFIDVSDAWMELTAIKHPVEIELLRHSSELAEAGVAAAIEAIKPGVSEVEVAAHAEFAMRTLGSEMTPVITNVASGKNAAIFERVATEKKIGTNETVIVDLGAVYKGYTSDLGRTVIVGKANARQRKAYQACRLALQEAIKAVRPGVACEEIDRIARRVIEEAGFKQYEHKWVTGHQLGYGLHGAPRIDAGVKAILKPNMVLALEPRIHFYDEPELGGVHLEDALLVTESGHELLTHYRFEDSLL